MYRLKVPGVSHRTRMNEWSAALSKRSASQNTDFELSRINRLLTGISKSYSIDKCTSVLPLVFRHFGFASYQALHDAEEYNYRTICAQATNWCNFTVPKMVITEKVSHFSMRRPISSVLFTSTTNSLSLVNSRRFHTSAQVSIYTDIHDSIAVKDKKDNKYNFKGTDLKNQNLGNSADQNREDVFGNLQYETEYPDGEELKIPNSSLRRRNSKTRGIAKEVENTDSAQEVEVFDGSSETPRAVLNNVYMIVSSELKNKIYLIKPIFTKKMADSKTKEYWTCAYHVLWPEIMDFSATARSKQHASHAAALKCLTWLKMKGKLKDGKPVIYDPNEIKSLINKPARIEVPANIIAELNELMASYEQDIKGLLESSETGKTKFGPEVTDVRDGSEDELEEDISSLTRELDLPFDQLIDPLRGTPLMEYSAGALRERDMEMFHKLRSKQFVAENNLPIMDYRDDIIKELQNERVVVIKGEPGCGKSTQLPQFILDHYVEAGKGSECNIVITQPRRISAISLAKRVAEERDEELGESIGYQVRLQSVPPKGPRGGILFCSTGILLRRMQSNPELLGCSHVIVDEAHERDLNTDVLLVLLNRALQKNPDLKVIIMSATINAGLFEKYFGCNTISVPGFTYPVQMHFLEDILGLGIRGIVPQDMSLPNPSVNAEQMAKLVAWISKNKPQGAILCFLPGWSEIQKLKRLLEEYLPTKTHLILPVHSRLPHGDQLRIFNRAPQGVRKIILATNIAETSITVDDVVYVVDSCAHKEVRLMADCGRSSIDNQWISQGNINQRKGRAGRVQPGQSFHFITKEKYHSLDEFPTPEIMRVELQKAVLDCKTYTPEKVAQFFAQMPEPPRTSAVEHAVRELIEMGALDPNENLTPLGKRIALFPIDPRLSKVMVYSSIFQCVNPILTLATILSSDFEIFADTLYNKAPIREMKRKFDPLSDHLGLTWIFHQWQSYLDKNKRVAEQFCRDGQLQFGKMLILKDVRKLYGQHLLQCRMLGTYERYEDLNAEINRYAAHDELVRGVLLAGLDRVLRRKIGEFKNGRFKKVNNTLLMQDGHRATLTPDSVNYNRQNWPSPYLVYQRHVHSAERRTTLIRDTSIVSPLTVLLFTEAEVKSRNNQNEDAQSDEVILTIQGKQNVKLVCDGKTATTLLQMRESLHNVTNYFVSNQGLIPQDPNMIAIKSFKTQLLQALSTLLIEANKQIQYDGNDTQSTDYETQEHD